MNSPVAMELLLEKNTVKQIIDVSSTEKYTENINDTSQVVSFGEKKLWSVFHLFIVFVFGGK